MGTKLQIVLCVLLLSNLGSAILGEDPAAPPSPTAEAHDLGEPGVPLPSSEHPPSSSSPESAGSDSLPGQDSTSLAAALAPEGSNTNTSSSNDNSSIAIGTTNNNTAMEVDGASVTPLVQHPPTASPLDSQEHHGGNATVVDLTAAPISPVDDRNLTEQSLPQPSLPPSDHHNTSTQTSLAPTTTAATTTTITTITTTAANTTTDTTVVHVPPTHSLHTTAPQHKTTHSPRTHNTTSPSRHPAHASTRHPTTHAPTVIPHRTEAATVTSTQSNSTAGPLPDAEPSPTTSHVDPGDSSPQTTGAAPHDIPPSNPSAQAKAHATPSQLNVGGDATVEHQAPTLDPLLAGLVSAFIVTAVIITLLLFLKLRRRDNRPQFHRLQDLPMDDMMEDTPLSMYSY